MGCRLSQLQVQKMCPDLVDMLEHRGSPSVSIPCSSFHHRSALRAAEATTMVLLWAKILIVQLDLTNDRIIPLPHPQGELGAAQLFVVPCQL